MIPNETKRRGSMPLARTPFSSHHLCTVIPGVSLAYSVARAGQSRTGKFDLVTYVPHSAMTLSSAARRGKDGLTVYRFEYWNMSIWRQRLSVVKHV
jgi:hypothetical protein